MVALSGSASVEARVVAALIAVMLVADAGF